MFLLGMGKGGRVEGADGCYRIQENAVNSPLLSLPGEIREKILMELVGGKVIHIFNGPYVSVKLKKASPSIIPRMSILIRHSGTR